MISVVHTTQVIYYRAAAVTCSDTPCFRPQWTLPHAELRSWSQHRAQETDTAVKRDGRLVAIMGVTESRAAPSGGAPDAEQVRRIGLDADALEAFYVAHYADLVRYFARRVGDPHDAADLVADTFLAAIEAAAKYDPRRGRPLAWLLGIGHNTLRRFHREREANRRAQTRLAGRRLLDADDIAALEEQIDHEHDARLAYGLLDDLSATDRELVELVDITGLSPKEAAAALGLLPGLARLRLSRARAKLRTALQLQEESQ
jgi:RNA polymerase sigma factor (sigma-70 family)